MGAGENGDIAGTAHVGGAHPRGDGRFQGIKAHELTADESGSQGDGQDADDDDQEIEGRHGLHDGRKVNESRADAGQCCGGPGFDRELAPFPGRVLQRFREDPGSLDQDHQDDHPGVGRNDADEVVEEGAQLIEGEGDDEAGEKALEGRFHGRPGGNGFPVVHQTAVSGEFRPAFPQIVDKAAEDDGDHIPQHGGRCDPGQHFPRVRAQNGGIHGGKGDRACGHAAAGHGDIHVEQAFQKGVSEKHAEKAGHHGACSNRKHCRRQDAHRCPDEKVAVDVEEAAADQGRDVEHQEIIAVHEVVHDLQRIRGEETHSPEHCRAQNAEDGAAEVGLHHRYRVSDGVQPFAEDHEEQHAAHQPLRDTAGIHTADGHSQDPEV